MYKKFTEYDIYQGSATDVVIHLQCSISRANNMKSTGNVSEIMTSEVITISITDTLTAAKKLLEKNKIRHLLVLEKGKLVGMLSYTDLSKICIAIENENDNVVDFTLYNMFTIEQVMTKDLVTVQVDDSIRSVAKILAERDFRALPVMLGNILVGILTTTDLIRYILRQH